MSKSKLIERSLQVAQLIQDGVNRQQDIIRAIDQIPRLAYNREGFELERSQKALQRDIARLRGMGRPFHYDPRQGVYVPSPKEGGVADLTLTPDELVVLAQLRNTHRFTPFAGAALSLHDKIAHHLPAQQRASLQRNPLIQMSIPALDELSLHMETAQVVSRAFDEQRELEFHYLMKGKTEPFPMRVQVISALEMQDGHAYFGAFSLKSDVERTFRLDRVVRGSAKLLPAKRPRRTRRSMPLRLRYWLAGHIEPTRHFPTDFHVEPQDDGNGAIVSATIDERDLFRAAKILLKYGQNCIVIEPSALVDEVRRAVEEMAKNYGLLE